MIFIVYHLSSFTANSVKSLILSSEKFATKNPFSIPSMNCSWPRIFSPVAILVCEDVVRNDKLN